VYVDGNEILLVFVVNVTVALSVEVVVVAFVVVFRLSEDMFEKK